MDFITAAPLNGATPGEGGANRAIIQAGGGNIQMVRYPRCGWRVPAYFAIANYPGKAQAMGGLTSLLKSGIFMKNDDFEWDDKKAAENYRKHRISFEVACEVFDDPAAVDEIDTTEHYDEIRFNIIGAVGGRLLFVTYTVREFRQRLISARLAEPHERRRYHEEKR